MVASRTQRRYTFDDYLSVEEMSRVRHEYIDGEILAMAGGTPENAALSAAIVVLLGKKLAGGTCRPYSSDLRIRVHETGLATYADASVICGEPIRDPDSPTHVTNPSVVVEVLSASTEAYDRGEKREHYQRIQSLKEYVLVSQDRRQVEVLVRRHGLPVGREFPAALPPDDAHRKRTLRECGPERSELTRAHRLRSCMPATTGDAPVDRQVTCDTRQKHRRPASGTAQVLTAVASAVRVGRVAGAFSWQ
jgi:Uma2 family endonuclease